MKVLLSILAVVLMSSLFAACGKSGSGAVSNPNLRLGKADFPAEDIMNEHEYLGNLENDLSKLGLVFDVKYAVEGDEVPSSVTWDETKLDAPADMDREQRRLERVKALDSFILYAEAFLKKYQKPFSVITEDGKVFENQVLPQHIASPLSMKSKLAKETVNELR